MSTEIDQKIAEECRHWQSLQEQGEQYSTKIRALREPINDWEARLSAKPLVVALSFRLLNIGYPKAEGKLFDEAYAEYHGLLAQMFQSFGDLGQMIAHRPGKYPLDTILRTPTGVFTYGYGWAVEGHSFMIRYFSRGILARRSPDSGATISIEPPEPPTLALPKQSTILCAANWPYFHGLKHPVYFKWQPLLTEEPRALAFNDKLPREWRKTPEEALTYGDFVLMRNTLLAGDPTVSLAHNSG